MCKQKSMQDFMLTNRTTFKGKFMALISIILILLGIGTVVYHNIEKWSYVDSFYFSAISLTTRGYGELHPTTTFSKIFTVFYLFIGVIGVIYAFSSLVAHYIHYNEPIIQKKMDNFMKTVAPPKKDKWVILKSPMQEVKNNFFKK